jgi:hypothetical protein
LVSSRRESRETESPRNRPTWNEVESWSGREDLNLRPLGPEPRRDRRILAEKGGVIRLAYPQHNVRLRAASVPFVRPRCIAPGENGGAPRLHHANRPIAVQRPFPAGSSITGCRRSAIDGQPPARRRFFSVEQRDCEWVRDPDAVKGEPSPTEADECRRWPRDVRPYQARHSFALELGERGTDRADVSALLRAPRHPHDEEALRARTGVAVEARQRGAVRQVLRVEAQLTRRDHRVRRADRRHSLARDKRHGANSGINASRRRL